MKIFSSAFDEGGHIPKKYSRLGGDVSPPLSFLDVPKEAKSLVLICHDPDAPRLGGWTHWLVWNISPETEGIPEGEPPKDAPLGLTDWGENRWGGPQPPSGTHRYIFYLYALDTEINLYDKSDRQQLLSAMQGHILDESKLTGLFSA